MLKVGFYETEITPPLQCSMPGYGIERLAEGVKEKLYAKAMMTDNGTNQTGILVLDALCLTTEIYDTIIKRITAHLPLEEGQITVVATHTHTGPPVKEYMDLPYLDNLCRLAADCVILAHQRMENARVKYGCGRVDHISFNRTYLMKDGTIKTNPGRQNPDIVKSVGEIDPDLAILFTEGEEGIPKGAIINFACHQDCVGVRDFKGYSGDFASILSAELKKKYGQNFVCMFVPGACGDINHIDVTKEITPLDHYKKMGRILAKEAADTIEKAQYIEGSGIFTQKEYLTLDTRTATPQMIKEAEEAIALDDKVDEQGNRVIHWFEVRLAHRLLEYARDQEKSVSLPVQLIKIGEVWLYFMPGEIFVRFQKYIKEHSPGEKNIVVSLSNGECGYVPTADLMLPTVYEAKLRKGSCLEPLAGNKMSEKLIQMAKQTV